MDVLMRQISHCSLVFVGDSCQRMFNFKDSSDPLVSIRASHSYYLTQVSFTSLVDLLTRNPHLLSSAMLVSPGNLMMAASTGAAGQKKNWGGDNFFFELLVFYISVRPISLY